MPNACLRGIVCTYVCITIARDLLTLRPTSCKWLQTRHLPTCVRMCFKDALLNANPVDQLKPICVCASVLSANMHKQRPWFHPVRPWFHPWSPLFAPGRPWFDPGSPGAILNPLVRPGFDPVFSMFDPGCLSCKDGSTLVSPLFDPRFQAPNPWFALGVLEPLV